MRDSETDLNDTVDFRTFYFSPGSKSCKPPTQRETKLRDGARQLDNDGLIRPSHSRTRVLHSDHFARRWRAPLSRPPRLELYYTDIGTCKKKHNLGISRSLTYTLTGWSVISDSTTSPRTYVLTQVLPIPLTRSIASLWHSVQCSASRDSSRVFAIHTAKSRAHQPSARPERL